MPAEAVLVEPGPEEADAEGQAERTRAKMRRRMAARVGLSSEKVQRPMRA